MEETTILEGMLLREPSPSPPLSPTTVSEGSESTVVECLENKDENGDNAGWDCSSISVESEEGPGIGECAELLCMQHQQMAVYYIITYFELYSRERVLRMHHLYRALVLLGRNEVTLRLRIELGALSTLAAVPAVTEAFTVHCRQVDLLNGESSSSNTAAYHPHYPRLLAYAMLFTLCNLALCITAIQAF